jgi:glycosyltransferase involved in cell wall biosynthesis
MPALRSGSTARYLIPGARIDSRNRYVVFANRETGCGLVPRAENFECIVHAVPAAVRPARILWEQIVLPASAVRHRLDVLLNPGFTAPILCPCPQVTVFHDLQHKRHPEHFRWFEHPFWRIFLWAAAHRSRILLADSEVTAADLHHFYTLPREKVRVVGLAVDEECLAIAARRHPEPFLLSISTLHPHKNLDALLRAFARFRGGHPEYRLVIPGVHGFFTRQLLELRASLDLEETVDFPGWIPRADLLDLYARASAFIYPSRFEGFGLPVVEALAAGVPTACSRIEPLTSLVEGAALEFDPLDDDALFDAMRRLAGDEALRQQLSDAGPRRAATFSWENTATATLRALTDAAGGAECRAVMAADNRR